jgi:hypothetical protein
LPHPSLALSTSITATNHINTTPTAEATHHSLLRLLQWTHHCQPSNPSFPHQFLQQSIISTPIAPTITH